MPLPAKPHCGIAPRDGESVTLCDTRRVALRTGEMIWDRVARHWVWPLPPYQILKKVPAYGWDFCPFCGGEMPAPVK